jgi:CBS domain-containing protein
MATPTVTTSTRGLAAPPETLVDDPPVHAVMGPLAPLEVPGSTRVATALHRLRENGCEHLITRDHGQVRAVAEVDLLRHLLDGGARPTRLLDTVSDVATPVPSVGSTLRRSQAAALMLRGDHTLLVVLADGAPCGVIDARTLLHSVAEGGPGRR